MGKRIDGRTDDFPALTIEVFRHLLEDLDARFTISVAHRSRERGSRFGTC